MSDIEESDIEQAVQYAITDRSPLAFANIAECQVKWTDSPGGKWLQGIADDVAERAEEILTGQYPEDVLHEIADSAVPIYTDDRFEILVETRSYYEDDLYELAGPRSDLVQLAGIALYKVAERLAFGLWDALKGEIADIEEQREYETEAEEPASPTDGQA